MMLQRGESGSSLGMAVGTETCKRGKERRGGCENFLHLRAVSLFSAKCWILWKKKEKLQLILIRNGWIIVIELTITVYLLQR